MEERDITALIGELAEDARVLDASSELHDPQLLGSLVTRLREGTGLLYGDLRNGPRPWKDADGGAWVAMTSAGRLEEYLALPELNWADIGAAASFIVSGIEQVAAKWSELLKTSGTAGAA